jgi:hypothetical protein
MTPFRPSAGLDFGEQRLGVEIGWVTLMSPGKPDELLSRVMTGHTVCL